MTAKERDALLVRLDERVKTLFTNQTRTDNKISKLVDAIDEHKRERKSNWYKKVNMVGLWVTVLSTIIFNITK